MALFYFLLVKVIFLHGNALAENDPAVNFRITSYKACIASDKVLNTVPRVSLQQCVDECASKAHCRAVNYFRYFQRCEHLPADTGTLTKGAGTNRSCVLVKKVDMDLTQAECSCGAGESCDRECTIKECEPLPVENGRLFGNMLSVGSTVTFECDQIYPEINNKSEATCLENGTWSYYPQCKRDCDDPLQQIGNATLTNGNTYEGETRTFVCDPGLIFPSGNTSMTVRCQSDSKWSAMLCPTEVDKNNLCNGCIFPRDCEDIQAVNKTAETGQYEINPVDNAGFVARCDMDTPPGGWTVIQRRISNSDFKKNWAEYKEGFGDLNNNFWLGNDKIWKLTNSGQYKLRIDLTDQNGGKGFAEYSSFSIGDASSKFILNISGHSGTASDSLIIRHNGMKFSTFDKDNDIANIDCADMFKGGWWYSNCQSSNINGPYGAQEYNRGMTWKVWRNPSVFMRFTEMKTRRK